MPTYVTVVHDVANMIWYALAVYVKPCFTWLCHNKINWQSDYVWNGIYSSYTLHCFYWKLWITKCIIHASLLACIYKRKLACHEYVKTRTKGNSDHISDSSTTFETTSTTFQKTTRITFLKYRRWLKDNSNDTDIKFVFIFGTVKLLTYWQDCQENFWAPGQKQTFPPPPILQIMIRN